MPAIKAVSGSRVGKIPNRTRKREKKKAEGEKTAAFEAPIRVFVNNRLGSRAEISCFLSDTVGDFKKLVAMRLGVQAESVLLKRQGQRPMKDSISLVDYEVGNGSLLDLEVDMGE